MLDKELLLLSVTDDVSSATLLLLGTVSALQVQSNYNLWSL